MADLSYSAHYITPTDTPVDILTPNETHLGAYLDARATSGAVTTDVVSAFIQSVAESVSKLASRAGTCCAVNHGDDFARLVAPLVRTRGGILKRGCQRSGEGEPEIQRPTQIDINKSSSQSHSIHIIHHKSRQTTPLASYLSPAHPNSSNNTESVYVQEKQKRTAPQTVPLSALHVVNHVFPVFLEAQREHEHKSVSQNNIWRDGRKKTKEKQEKKEKELGHPAIQPVRRVIQLRTSSATDKLQPWGPKGPGRKKSQTATKSTRKTA
ncbi:hypothetical protein IWZ01DRAFT_572087 [Phyllosticta capitalensis]